MTRMRKKIMCLALSLAFGVMSSQAQAIGNSTQILAERDSTILKFCDLGGFGWRSQPRSIVFHPYYVKNSEDFNIYISYVKSLLLSNQRWTPYAILGTIEHTKKIIEGKNSLATNLFGSLRQIAIATDGKYTRGGTQILEQLTSDKHDLAKIGEGIGYILKGMGWRYYYPFIGASQSLVSSYRTFFTPIRTQHYAPSTVYDELTEIPKQIGAIIDMTLGMNTARRNLFYSIRGTMGSGEQLTRMLLNYDVMDEPTCRVLTHGLRGVRHGLAVATPVWTAAYWFGSLLLAVGGTIVYSVTMVGSWMHSIFTPSSDEPDIIPPYSNIILPNIIKISVDEREQDAESINILRHYGHRYFELPKEEVAQLESEKGWEALHIDIKYLNFPRYFILRDNNDPNSQY